MALAPRRLATALLLPLAALAGCAATPPIVEGRAPVGGGDTLYYRMVGAGPDTIVFLHGGPAVSSRYLEASFRTLARRHVLLFYDARGRGRSSAAAQPDSLSLWQDADDLEALRARLGLGPLKLVGHNWGAGLAFEYARRHPAMVRRLVLLSPMLLRMEYSYFLLRSIPADSAADAGYQAALAAGRDSTDPAGFCRDFWGWGFGPWRPVERRVVRILGPEICDAPPDELRARARVRRALLGNLGAWNWETALDSVPVPRLVIVGSGEAAFVRAAERWAGGRDGQLLQAGTSPHFPWVESPDLVASSIEEFLIHERWPGGATPVTAVSAR
jgi:proline iminopeptidase